MNAVLTTINTFGLDDPCIYYPRMSIVKIVVWTLTYGREHRKISMFECGVDEPPSVKRLVDKFCDLCGATGDDRITLQDIWKGNYATREEKIAAILLLIDQQREWIK